MNTFIKSNILCPLLILPAAVGLMASCSDWDDHYDGNSNDNGNQTLLQLIDANPQLSAFAQVLHKTGVSDKLASSQTYTVFAPVNSALAQIDTTNLAQLSRIANNHIARYTQPSSTPDTCNVQMLNGKVYHFNNASDFEGSPLITKNEKAVNGLLHTVSSTIPYFSNLYEYMQDNEEYSDIYQFIHQFDERKFDQDNSTEVDVDDQGRPVYDSVWVSYNQLLENPKYGIGKINNEDSAYTMLLPDNKAWQAAYSRIAPYFAIYSDDKNYADSIQDVRTKIAIVSDLIYKPSTQDPLTADSLVSTTGSVISSPSSLFAGTRKVEASNGNIYTASQLNYDNTETWNKPISVEAEQQNGRTYNNTLTTVFTRNTVQSSPVQNISGDSYIEVQPISSTSNPVLIFDIPNVLAGTYNIYAVFLPATTAGADATLDSTRISFTLQYMNAQGRTVSQRKSSMSDKNLLTNAGSITVMKAFSNFAFPVSNTTDRLWLMQEGNDEADIITTTKLTIQTNVSSKEYSNGKYARNFRLDRIVFEPVKQ